MGRSSAFADVCGSRFDEENTVPAGGRAAERPWNRIHSANEAAQRDLSVNQHVSCIVTSEFLCDLGVSQMSWRLRLANAGPLSRPPRWDTSLTFDVLRMTKVAIKSDVASPYVFSPWPV